VEYRQAVGARSSDSSRVRAAAAVELQELDASAVLRYLCDDATGPTTKKRWESVFTALGEQNPLRTPLLASLARVIYNPRPGEAIAGIRDPVELLEHRADNRHALESTLFDGFIAAAYRGSNRWRAEQSERWLAYIGFRLENMTYESKAPWGFGLWGLFTQRPGKQALRLATKLSTARLGVMAGLVIALSCLVIWTNAVNFQSYASSTDSPLTITGAIFILLFFFVALSSPQDLTKAQGARLVLRRDRALTLAISEAFLAVLLPYFMLDAKGQVDTVGLIFGLLIGLTGGVAVAIMIGAAWPSYMFDRNWQALLRRVPWPLFSFLEDAHRRGVVRQVGAVYEFRHIELQRHLARQYAERHPRAAGRVHN
jgi:hypothetical protein